MNTLFKVEADSREDERVYVSVSGRSVLDILRDVAQGKFASMVVDSSQARELLALIEGKPPT